MGVGVALAPHLYADLRRISNNIRARPAVAADRHEPGRPGVGHPVTDRRVNLATQPIRQQPLGVAEQHRVRHGHFLPASIARVSARFVASASRALAVAVMTLSRARPVPTIAVASIPSPARCSIASARLRISRSTSDDLSNSRTPLRLSTIRLRATSTPELAGHQQRRPPPSL